MAVRAAESPRGTNPTRALPSLTWDPQDPKDVARDIARDLSALVGELAALNNDAALGHRLEGAYAAAEAALVEARRRVRTDQGR